MPTPPGPGEGSPYPQPWSEVPQSAPRGGQWCDARPLTLSRTKHAPSLPRALKVKRYRPHKALFLFLRLVGGRIRLPPALSSSQVSTRPASPGAASADCPGQGCFCRGFGLPSALRAILELHLSRSNAGCAMQAPAVAEPPARRLVARRRQFRAHSGCQVVVAPGQSQPVLAAQRQPHSANKPSPSPPLPRSPAPPPQAPIRPWPCRV